MDNIIIKFWPVIIAVISVIVWLARLESKVKKHDTDIQEVKSDNKEEIREINRKLDNMASELNKICISFSELSGYIKGKECNDNQ